MRTCNFCDYCDYFYMEMGMLMLAEKNTPKPRWVKKKVNTATAKKRKTRCCKKKQLKKQKGVERDAMVAVFGSGQIVVLLRDNVLHMVQLI